MKLVDGPFSKLDGHWKFTPLGRRAAARLQGRTGTALRLRERRPGRAGGPGVRQDRRQPGRCLRQAGRAGLWLRPVHRASTRAVFAGAARGASNGTSSLPPGATVLQALQASGLAAAFPELDLARPAWASGAARPRLEQPLRDGDRVEIYRPLKVDPKVARRERFREQGARAAGLFAKRGRAPSRLARGRRDLQSLAMIACRGAWLRRRAAASSMIFALALGVGARDAHAGVECRPWRAWRGRSSRPRLGDLFFLGLLLLGLGGFGLLLLLFQLLVLAAELGRAARLRRAAGSAPLRPRRRGAAARLARPAGLQDVLGRDVGRRRLVAEHLAAVLVDPLPLGEAARRARSTQGQAGSRRSSFIAPV